MCDAIWNTLSEEYVKAPSIPDEWRGISHESYERRNFPHCCGALDGKHVLVQAPHNSGSAFYNYKGTFSLVLMAVCSG